MQISKRCPWVTGIDGTQARVLSVGYVDAESSTGKYGIYVFADYQKRMQWGVPFDQLTPETQDRFETAPEMIIDISGGNFDPAHGDGPIDIQLFDARVNGMGMPLRRHVIYVVSFLLAKPYLD